MPESACGQIVMPVPGAPRSWGSNAAAVDGVRPPHGEVGHETTRTRIGEPVVGCDLGFMSETLETETRTARRGALAALTAGAAVAASLIGASPASAATVTAWDRVASCEAGGNWHINTGNGYYGGLQFSLGTWHGYGGTGLPSQHSREEQIRIAIKLRNASGGYGAWPGCAASLGLPT